MTGSSHVLRPDLSQSKAASRMAADDVRLKPVVVLGGAGFVGSAIVDALSRAGLATVSAQHRAGVARDGVARDGVRQVICDATRPADLSRALQGAGWVVNAVSGNRETMLAATTAMAEAARGGCRIVHVSSMAVYGDRRGYVRETALLRAASAYGATKIACEAVLRDTGAVILRPGLVYGPGSTQWVGRIGLLLRAGRLGDLGKHGDGRCNLVHVRDLGEAVVAAIGNPEASGRAINLGMTAPPRWNDYLVALGRAIGAVPVRRIAGWRLALERLLVAPPLFLAKRAARHLAPSQIVVPELISSSLYKQFSHDIVLDCTLAGRLLAYPQTCLADGMAESATWFIETYGLAHG